jgi:hypothetical protein
LLQRISRLEDFMQEGIPVVARFLSEFLAEWDGKELFLEVMGLLAYIQITDFEELQDCILAPLISLFTASFSPMEKTLFMVYLNKLLLHWIHLEYDRCKFHQTRMFGAANPNCRNPLEAISCLLRRWVSLAELGLAKIVFQSSGDGRSSKSRRDDRAIYFNEVLTMSLTVRES